MSWRRVIICSACHVDRISFWVLSRPCSPWRGWFASGNAGTSRGRYRLWLSVTACRWRAPSPLPDVTDFERRLGRPRQLASSPNAVWRWTATDERPT